jgi:hypothetical protein
MQQPPGLGMAKGMKARLLTGMEKVGGKDEWLMKKCLFDLPPGDFVSVPILFPITVVPLKSCDLAEVDRHEFAALMYIDMIYG